MQALNKENASAYSESIRELRMIVESLWNESSFQEKFAHCIQEYQKLLENRLDGMGINSSNCVFVCSGKSAAVSEMILNSLVQRDDNTNMSELVSNMITLNSNENEEMYTGKVPDTLQSEETQGKTLFFFDEHAQEYLKASSYLATAEKEHRKALYFVFSGNQLPAPVLQTTLASHIIIASKDEEVRTFLSALGRIVSESNRQDLPVSETVSVDFSFSREILSTLNRD